ncbi:hypothetical protein FQN57_004134 [Myotisia sp. PD_48]|nr:hypothetical protein FQN57_004134 [Myotisia sp. PD_48]
MRVFQDIFQSWPALSSLSQLLVPYPNDTSPSLGFDPIEATIGSVHEALISSNATCREVVSAFLQRIQTYNPIINAIISLDPDALSVADTLDHRIHSVLNQDGTITGERFIRNCNPLTDICNSISHLISMQPLFCIPILLKDNFDTTNVPTTAGCKGLADSPPPLRDAAVVTRLRNAGAIILGKTNMHEMALQGLSVSSLGGQTLNPYDLSRTPGGSSGGTGAAIAASFAVLGLGTDTMNSLRSPASANSLFSVKPTRGLITRAGVLPVSYTQDTVGVITRCVRDLVLSLDVMASGVYDGDSIGEAVKWYDPRDNMTALKPRWVAREAGDMRPYSEGDLHLGQRYNVIGRLKGRRFGILEGFFNHTNSPEVSPVNKVMKSMIARLEQAGAILVPITETIYNSTAILGLDVQAYEYREALDNYFAQHHLERSQQEETDTNTSPPTPLRTTEQLYAKSIQNNNSFLVIPHQYPFITAALVSSPLNASYATKKLAIESLSLSVKRTFLAHRLDALIYPQQMNLPVKIGSHSQYGRNGILAALIGHPVITVPAGFSDSPPKYWKNWFASPSGHREEEAPIGVPVGMELMGNPWEEERLLYIAAGIEGLGRVRRIPDLERYIRKESRKKRDDTGVFLAEVPYIVPNKNNIPAVYPLGVYD